MYGWELMGTEPCLAPRVPKCSSFVGGKYFFEILRKEVCWEDYGYI